MYSRPMIQFIEIEGGTTSELPSTLYGDCMTNMYIISTPVRSDKKYLSCRRPEPGRATRG